ncbi:MAG TPA: hypothetical protein VHG33_08020, partial [Woeseiaceae bacterium]|nr:hypothetical protein [Woeseiaceae bacterium]
HPQLPPDGGTIEPAEFVRFVTQLLLGTIAIDNARLFDEARKELAERNRAEEQLRNKTHELSRFNRAAVGRELRMIELKKEINGLCNQLGQPARYPLHFEADTEAADA